MNDTLPNTVRDPSTIIVRERLRLLAIGHYVYSGMGLFMLPFLFPFLGMMIFMASIPEEQWNKPGKPAQQIEDGRLEASPTASPPRDYH